MSIERMSLTLTILIASMGSNANSQNTQDTLFYRSLHFTARGMSYWYDAENGGLESVTEVPYDKLGCQNCHVAGCGRCHLGSFENAPAYSVPSARKQDMCLECHAREALMFKIDAAADQQDVHVRGGMTCMDCHSAREMHGDGHEYDSMKQDGAMDTRCEGCHTPNESRAHTIHGGKLDCNACHQRHVVSCTNCHFETLLQEGKRVSIPVSGWLFLMNLDSKVTSATMQSFVVKGKKTFLMFAPQHSHSIMQKGRQCGDCHGLEMARRLDKGAMMLTWMRDARLENMKGVIPVVDGMRWDLLYQERELGTWVPLKDPRRPRLHYAGYGKPLSAVQAERLRTSQVNSVQ